MVSMIPQAAVDYPADLPWPNMSPYNWNVGMGGGSMKMNGGNLLYRRKWKHMPHLFEFQFEMDTGQMARFVDFVHEIGADWFNLNSLSAYTTMDARIVEKQPVRFIGDVTVEARGFNWWGISIPAELSPDVYRWVIGYDSSHWIIARTPDNPSTNWVIAAGGFNSVAAGAPGTPSPYGTVAGRPPAAAPDRIVSNFAIKGISTDWVIAGTPVAPGFKVE